MTSLLIITGLSVVHLSQFVPTRRFAELTSVTMCAALLGDLILLPACLKIAVLWGAKKKEQRPVLRVIRGDDVEPRAAV